MASHTCGAGGTSSISPAQGASRCFPIGNHDREGALARNAPLGGGAIRARQHAERIFGREQFVLGHAAMVDNVGHCSRQAFNLIIARRIQLFIVPSGTLMRAASSS